MAAVRGERDRARPRADLHAAGDLERRRVNREHLVVGFAGDVDLAPVGPDGDAFGFAANGDAMGDGAAGQIERRTSPPSPRSRRTTSGRRATRRTPRDPARWHRSAAACAWPDRRRRCRRRTRSGGGSVDSSTPGGAIGEPDSATKQLRAVRRETQATRPLADRDPMKDLSAEVRVEDHDVAAGLVRDVDDRGRRLRCGRRRCGCLRRRWRR